MTATAPPVNSVPVANAGPDQDAVTWTTVTLDGSASNDADGDALTYAWTIIMPPPGSAAVLTGADTANPTFVPDLSGPYLIRLLVSDGMDESVADTVTINAKATFVFSNYYVQYRINEGVTPFYRYFLAMTRDGVPFDPATQISAMRFLDSSNNILGTTNAVSFEYYMSLNCMTTPCIESGPIREVAFVDNFTFLPVDTYSFEVDTLDGQNLRLDVPFPGSVDIPVISSSTMQSSFVGNDLVLTWTNPVGDPNWAEVDQLRIRVVDLNGEVVLYVRVPTTTETVTISGALLDQAAALSNSMMTTWDVISAWEMQTRAYDANNVNFARAISSRVTLVGPAP